MSLKSSVTCRTGGALVAAILIVATTSVARLSAWSSSDPTRVVTYEGVNNSDDGVLVNRIFDQLAIGDDGSIYTLVLTGGTVTVGEGDSSATIGVGTPDYSTVLTKTDANGEMEWQRSWSFTTNEYFFGNSIAVSGSRVLIVGNASDGRSVDLDPTAGVSSYTATGEDAVIVELTTSGEFVGSVAFRVASGLRFSISRLAVAADGDPILIGSYTGTVTLPGGSTRTTSVAYQTTLLARVDVASNTTTWVAELDGNDGSGGDNGSVAVADIDVSSDGSLLVAGYFDATNLVATNADGTSLAALVNSNPGTPLTNALIAKIDQSGQFAWVIDHDAGPSAFIYPTNVMALRGGGSLVSMHERSIIQVSDVGAVSAVARPDYPVGGMDQTSDGRIQIVGAVTGPGAVDFDFGPGAVNFTADVDEDAFVLTLNEDLTYQGLHTIAASGRQRAVFVRAHPDGGFVVAGSGEAYVTELSNTSHAATYTPSSGKDMMMFIIRYDASGTTGTTTTTTTTTVAPTTAPASASYTTGNKKVTVRWSEVAGAASYVVYSSSGDVKCTSSVTSCAITGLRNGKIYTWTVRSVNAAGAVSADARSVRVIPGFRLRTTTYKVRKAPKLTSIVSTPSKGAKQWRVTSGSCRISGSRLVMPAKKGTCRLKLSVAKRGSYPAMSTTVKVNVTR